MNEEDTETWPKWMRDIAKSLGHEDCDIPPEQEDEK